MVFKATVLGVCIIPACFTGERLGRLPRAGEGSRGRLSVAVWDALAGGRITGAAGDGLVRRGAAAAPSPAPKAKTWQSGVLQDVTAKVCPAQL